MSTLQNKIFALVGPSGCGKSTLIKETERFLRDKLSIIKSLTTRPLGKDEFDALFYDFVSFQELNKKLFTGELVEWVEYTGNLYGYERATIDSVLESKHGICAATEYGVIALMNSGYSVWAIKIIPLFQKKAADAKRIEADRERVKLNISYQKEIVNLFLKGGKEKTVKELTEYIKKSIRK